MNPSDLLSALMRGRDAVFGRRTYSAMSPIIWMTVTAGLTCVVGGGATLADDRMLRAVVVGFGLLFMTSGVLTGIYFAGWHPERLQSEDHIIREQVVAVMESRARKIDVTGEHLAIVAIGEPPRSLGRGEPDGGDRHV